jgi:hypothetical protein
MKKFITILILGIMFVPSLAYSYKGVDVEWINSKIFQAIKGAYGEKISSNDGKFDCEDFVAAYFLTMEGTVKIPVLVWFSSENAHAMVGMISINGQNVVVLEPQDGRFVIAKTFEEAVKQFYPKRKFRIQLYNYESFMRAVLEKTK